MPRGYLYALLGLLAVPLVAGGCLSLSPYRCEQADQCVQSGEAGFCEPTGFCSFPDPACPSVRRYTSHAGDGLANLCVDLQEDAGVDGRPDAGDDSGQEDAAVDSAADGGQLLEVLHVPAEGSYAGTADLLIDGEAQVNTTTLERRNLELPPGVVLDAWPQDPTGPELAVLHVRSMTITKEGSLRAVGTRPLVIIASDAVVVSGLLDVGADLATPGAGGFATGLGPGAGGAPSLTGDQNPGGGGAGYGTDGASGGDARGAQDSGGLPGAAYGEPEVLTLTGGSGGGSGAPGSCATLGEGGAGGGAIQIHAVNQVTVSGSGIIAASGGGGPGGPACSSFHNGGGAGGGSGGTILLRGRQVLIQGVVAANGGGGGAGAGITAGEAGQNGQLSSAQAQPGACLTSPCTSGGAGGSLDGAPAPGVDCSGVGCSSSGGGGGAEGRIRLLVNGPVGGGGLISPAPAVGPL